MCLLDGEIMMLHRVTTTIDSLSEVILTLAYGGMSGLLIARRENDPQAEEGKILFSQGKIVEATAPYRMGADALAWMRTWKGCVFSFHPSEESQHMLAVSPKVLDNRIGTGKIAAPRREPPAGGVSETAKGTVVLPNAQFSGRVPYRIESNEKALQWLKAARHSRLHRHVFLLVDGRRSVDDLVRLTGHGRDEVISCLRDLKKLRIICCSEEL
jgi:hypothetical protein